MSPTAQQKPHSQVWNSVGFVSRRVVFWAYAFFPLFLVSNHSDQTSNTESSVFDVSRQNLTLENSNSLVSMAHLGHIYRFTNFLVIRSLLCAVVWWSDNKHNAADQHPRAVSVSQSALAFGGGLGPAGLQTYVPSLILPYIMYLSLILLTNHPDIVLHSGGFHTKVIDSGWWVANKRF